MQIQERRLVDELLTSEEPCHGAVFCSYTFDPAYFEDHVLRGVLRLSGDPEEDAVRYHSEARRALKETPVACFIDASVRQPGHRLPYDLHLVRWGTFHPKVFLLVYDTEARLAVGSGNLTKAGLEQNTELFFSRRLRYDRAEDVALLREVDAFLGSCQKLAGAAGAARAAGTALDRVRSALADRLRGAPELGAGQSRDVRFVDSFAGGLIHQLDGELHPQAKITRVGVLAPFFEQDDLAAAADEDGMRALLAKVLALRPTKDAVLDLGVPWDDAPVAAPASANLPALDEGTGRLWAWRWGEEAEGKAVERVEYFTLKACKARRIEATRADGSSCRFEREECQAAIADRQFWPVAKLTVHAPETILKRIAKEHEVCLWLHPTTALASNKAVRRPLHAKAVLVTAAYRGRFTTHALIGSANASGAALARGVGEGGNVEACVLCRFEGEVTLRDLLPSLVCAPLEGIEWGEREAIERGTDLSAWIDEVMHDAAAHTLSVTWCSDGPAPLQAWELRYLERCLASAEGVPAAPATIEGFELGAASAEVTFLSGGGEWQVPIRVLDLAALPMDPLLQQLGLGELLALLGRRLGSERLATLRAQRGPAGVASVLDVLFGEGFGPPDVFKAWWGAVEDLKLAATVGAFRERLQGSVGVLSAWQQLREVSEDVLSRDEVWVYGCELHRELEALEQELPPSADTRAKRELLGCALTELEEELGHLARHTNGSPWLGEVAKFYGMGGTGGVEVEEARGMEETGGTHD